MHNPNPATKTISLFHGMGRQKNRHIARGFQEEQMVPDSLARDRVKSHCRLIKEQNTRLV
jgi:hypothetical protein